MTSGSGFEELVFTLAVKETLTSTNVSCCGDLKRGTEFTECYAWSRSHKMEPVKDLMRFLTLCDPSPVL